MMITQWKPLLACGTRIVENGDDLILNQTEFGYQLKLKKEFGPVLYAMDGTKDILELTNIYHSVSGKSISLAELEMFLNIYLADKGFIISQQRVKHRHPKTNVKFRFTILKKKVIDLINLNFLKPLFERVLFFPLLLASFLVNLIAFFFNKDSFFETNSILVISILFFSHILHELGHALAAKSKNAKPGDIGFGFYFVLPVFYVDLSDIWNLSKREKIIVNLSGVFFDYLFGAIMIALFFTTKIGLFAVIQILLFFKTFYNLNPVTKSDAYWVVADYINRPNLSDDAALSVRFFLKSLFSMNLAELKKVNLILVIFGLLNLTFWIYIIIKMLSYGQYLISDLKVLLVELKNMIFYNTWNFSLVGNKLVHLFIFLFTLFIVGKLLINCCRTAYRNLTRKWKIA